MNYDRHDPQAAVEVRFNARFSEGLACRWRIAPEVEEDASALAQLLSQGGTIALESDYERMRRDVLEEARPRERIRIFGNVYDALAIGVISLNEARATFDLPGVYSPEDFGAIADLTGAESRGETLLREWLSPPQLVDYDAFRHFDVIGCHTGTRYRITKVRTFNVKQLDVDGRELDRLCFMPRGGLVQGDVMLAQKIALETDEAAVLGIANRSSKQTIRMLVCHDWTGRIS